MKKTLQILTILLLLLSAGCTSDSPEPGDSLLLLTYSLDDLSLRAATENGVDTLNENTISDIHCYLSDREGSSLSELSIKKEEPGRIFIEKALLEARMTSGTTYRIYLLANTDGRVTPEDRQMLDLKEIGTSNGRAALPSIPMYGSTEVSYDPEVKVIGHVKLRRHLAKIRVTVLYKDRKMHRYGVYTKEGKRHPFWGVPQLMVMGLGVSSPLVPDPEGHLPTAGRSKTEYTILSQPRTLPDLPEASTHPFPIYSGPLEWDADDLERPRFLLKIPFYLGSDLEHATEANATYLYYTGTIARPSQVEGERQKLLPNTLYDVLINIDELGSGEEQQPKPISENVTIRPWGETHDVDINVDQAAFLQITPLQSDMYGDEKSFRFSSSSPLSEVTGISRYNRYDGISGALLPTEGSKLTGSLSYTLDRREGVITLKRSRPTLEVPHYYTITVTNEDGIQRTLKVTHYPEVVLTRTPSMDQSGNNPNMYIFTIPQYGMSGKYKIGYPDRESPTSEDNELVSPHFMISSWNHGDFDSYSYERALRKSKEYTEEDFMGHTYTGWRLPTQAEINLINEVSQKESGVTNRQSILSEGLTYWTIHEPQPEGWLRRVRLIYDLP